MCSRFIRKTDLQSLCDLFAAELVETDLCASYNIAPRQSVVVVMEKGKRKLVAMQWGLVPHWAKHEKIGSKLINARSEMLGENPTFRDSFKKRRCLVVADGFYEWKEENKKRVPWFICMKDERPFGMAGLHDIWVKLPGETIHTCTIVTTEANEFMKAIHRRMPVIIPREAYDEWLDPAQTDIRKPARLLKPCDAGLMKAHRVGSLVNSPVNDSEDCIRPVG